LLRYGRKAAIAGFDCRIDNFITGAVYCALIESTRQSLKREPVLEVESDRLLKEVN
jgi:hypothetical protein